MSRDRPDSGGTDSGRRTPLTLRHPKAVLVVAALILAALGIIGANVESKLDPTTLDIPGTNSSRANALVAEHFGDSAPFVILLRGPEAAVDRQGPELVRALRRDPKVTTLSPWDRGNVSQLRPDPRRALILADFHVDVKTAVNDTVEQLEGAIAEEIHPPVRATQTGYATISRAIQDESIASTEQGELLALPFLLLVLLLVFRSPVAAAIPLGFGAITVVASRGVLHFFAGWFSIDAFALTVCTMMGLALGVDYALLMVSRFREELAAGKDPHTAALVTRRTAGPHDALRRQHPADLDAGLDLRRARAAAGLAGGDRGDGRRPQRRRRHPRRPGPAGARRAQHQSLADRPARRTEARA